MSASSLLYEKLLRPILKAQGSPESIARGGAMGMWIALTPTVGIQMLLVAVLAVPLRCNVPVAIAMVWISNPLTVVPLYFGFYWLGALMLGRDSAGYEHVAESLVSCFAMVQDVGLLQALEKLGDEILWPMTVGSLVAASATALPTYHALLWLGRRRLERRLVKGLEQGDLEIGGDARIKRPRDDPPPAGTSEAPPAVERQPAPTPTTEDAP